MPRKKEFDVSSEMYLDKLFLTWAKEINLEIIHDLKLVQKYKGELAKSFTEVREQRSTLISCMQDIHETQDELKFIVLDLIKVITGHYPESIGRITAEEVI